MYEMLDQWLIEQFGDSISTSLMSALIQLLIALVFAGLVYIILRVINKFMLGRSRFENMKIIAKTAKEKNTISSTACFFFFVLLNNLLPTITQIGCNISLMFLACGIIDIINALYQAKDISKRRPIKGILSVVKVAVCILFGIILISSLLKQNPVVLISGVGAFTAVLSIVFKDALSGLVAGIQITSEHMFEIGDWISVPALGVEGEVKDIALISVKIQGFDNIMHTLPASTFMATSSKNWHKTIRNKMRQVKYLITVDPDTVTMDGEQTNLTLWRHSVIDKIKADPHYKSGFATQCRTQGSSSGYGIPVEVFFTVDIADYDEYCEFTSAFGSEITASLKDFGLKHYKVTSSQTEN